MLRRQRYILTKKIFPLDQLRNWPFVPAQKYLQRRRHAGTMLNRVEKVVALPLCA